PGNTPGAKVTLRDIVFLGGKLTLDAANTIDVRRTPWSVNPNLSADLTAVARPMTLYVTVTAASPDLYVKFQPAADLPLTIDADWDTGADVDILWTDAGGAVVACGGGCTGAKPERSVYTVVGGGIRLLDMNLYDGDDSNVTVIIQ
ncbi:MAG: hypothetical protein OER90_19665, partial [Gemmatimonadota bacterium]|nr:hypothetical protein [Gemmatimonadota bacterium]